MIITGSSDGTIRIWERREVDADTGEIYKKSRLHNHTYIIHLDEVICKQIINNGNKYPMSLALSYLPDSKSMCYQSVFFILYLLLFSSSHFRQWTHRQTHLNLYLPMQLQSICEDAYIARSR